VRIAVVVGTRPEAIKLAPVTKLLGQEAIVIHTGQHFSAGMSGHLTPHIVLDAHNGGDPTRGHQLGNLVTALDRVFGQHHPDVVLVQGDTTSALAAALAANTADTPLVHLEAGLRSFDRAMPEEHHRVLIDHLADLCCAPTPTARDNLLAERIGPERIEITGNTIVEAVATALPDERQQAQILGDLGLTRFGYMLATIHRPENADNPVNLAAILRQLTARGGVRDHVGGAGADPQHAGGAGLRRRSAGRCRGELLGVGRGRRACLAPADAGPAGLLCVGLGGPASPTARFRRRVPVISGG
jgi:UDP-N-acetylglucosamine 2-epimerase (non-hydrolysing)